MKSIPDLLFQLHKEGYNASITPVDIENGYLEIKVSRVTTSECRIDARVVSYTPVGANLTNESLYTFITEVADKCKWLFSRLIRLSTNNNDIIRETNCSNISILWNIDLFELEFMCLSPYVLENQVVRGRKIEEAQDAFDKAFCKFFTDLKNHE